MEFSPVFSFFYCFIFAINTRDLFVFSERDNTRIQSVYIQSCFCSTINSWMLCSNNLCLCFCVFSHVYFCLFFMNMRINSNSTCFCWHRNSLMFRNDIDTNITISMRKCWYSYNLNHVKDSAEEKEKLRNQNTNCDEDLNQCLFMQSKKISDCFWLWSLIKFNLNVFSLKILIQPKNCSLTEENIIQS